MPRLKPTRAAKKPARLSPQTAQALSRGRGRPTKYDPEYAELAKRCCIVYGSTVEELAKFLMVNTATIQLWRATHTDFSDAIKEGRPHADARVVERLYRRALGYEHPAVKIMVIDDKPVKVPYIERYPPDTAACIFWLKNRMPGEWRNTPDTPPTPGGDTYNIVMNMPAAPALGEDRSYRNGPVIEHQAPAA